MTDLMPDWVHQELRNWCAWCWGGEWPHPLPPTHCGSLESRYRSPPEWNPDDAPEAPYIRPNERNARKVQAVFDTLEGYERLVLLAEYPQRVNRGRTKSKQLAADRLGISQLGYDRYLQSAAAKVARAFEKEDHALRA